MKQMLWQKGFMSGALWSALIPLLNYRLQIRSTMNQNRVQLGQEGVDFFPCLEKRCFPRDPYE